ncbi:hypothetical protein R6Q57_018656 [Mikania cordata]
MLAPRKGRDISGCDTLHLSQLNLRLHSYLLGKAVQCPRSVLKVKKICFCLRELLSDKESNYRDARRRIDELTSEFEKLKSKLNKSNIHVDKSDYASTAVANMIDVQCRKKSKIGIGFTEVKPTFNHNYSIMPNINTFVHVSLTIDPIETGPNISDDSKVCADSLNKTGVRGKIEERSAGRSTDCSTSFGTSSFISNTDFVEKVDEFKIKTNEMSKNFNSTFVKNDVILESISSCLHHEYKGHSTVTKEAAKNRLLWKRDPPLRIPLKPVNYGSGARSKIDKDKSVKSKGVHKKEPVIFLVPKPVMVWAPISH